MSYERVFSGVVECFGHYVELWVVLKVSNVVEFMVTGQSTSPFIRVGVVCGKTVRY